MSIETTIIRVFCSYAHEDRHLFRQLGESLTVLRNQKRIVLWHDGEILPGTEWESAITRYLNEADIILLLVSPSFMDSECCRSKEIECALERHWTGAARVIPILLRPTVGWDTTPLGKLQALPTDAKPLTLWRNREKAFVDIAANIGNVVELMQQQDRYPIQEYVLCLIPSICMEDGCPDTSDVSKITWEMVLQKTNQWLQLVGSTTGYVLEQVNEREWIFIQQPHSCKILFHSPLCLSLDEGSWQYWGRRIWLTSSSLELLDQIVKSGQLSYTSLCWHLSNDLDLTAIETQIKEQTGRKPFTFSRDGYSSHLSYVLALNEKDTVRIYFFDRQLTQPAKVILVDEHFPSGRFYLAHKLFSVQKLVSILKGELPYKQMQQLIEQACAIPKDK